MSKFRLLLGISVFWLALSMLTDGLNSLVLPSQLLSYTATSSRATILGLLTFVGLLAAMFIQPMAGAWSDSLRPRWGRRGTLALGALLVLAGLGLLALPWGLPVLIAGYLLVQATASIAQSSLQGFIPDLVPTDWRGKASGLKAFMDVGGATVGFVLLGHLLSDGKILPGLGAIALVILITLLLTVTLVREPQLPGDILIGVRSNLVESFHLDLYQHRAFAWLIGARFFFLLGTFGVGRFLLYFVTDRLHLNPAEASKQTGIILAGLTLATAFGALPAGWAADRFGRFPLMVLGAALSGTGVLLLAFATSNWQIMLFGALMSLGSAAFSGANWALSADLAPPTEAARFLALSNMGNAGATAAAGLFGLLVDWVNRAVPGDGYLALFIAAAFAFAVSTLAVNQAAQAMGQKTPLAR